MTTSRLLARVTVLIVLFGPAVAVLPVRAAVPETSEIDLIAVSGGLYVMGDPGGDANEEPESHPQYGRRAGGGRAGSSNTFG